MFKFNFLNLAAEKVYGNDAVVAVAVAYFAVVIQLDGNVSHVDVTLNENLYRTRFVCLYVIIWQLHADYFGVVFFVLRSHVYDVNEHISVLVGHYTANNAQRRLVGFSAVGEKNNLLPRCVFRKLCLCKIQCRSNVGSAGIGQFSVYILLVHSVKIVRQGSNVLLVVTKRNDAYLTGLQIVFDAV